MKKLSIIILFVALASCKQGSNYQAFGGTIDDIKTQVIEIDKCEYIRAYMNVGYDRGLFSITHKGNCKNPIHDCNRIGIGDPPGSLPDKLEISGDGNSLEVIRIDSTLEAWVEQSKK